MLVIMLFFAFWHLSTAYARSSFEVSLQANDLHVEEKEQRFKVTLLMRKDLFEKNRDARYYAVLVSSRGAMESPIAGKWNGENWPYSRKWENAVTSNGTVLMYQTTPVKWEPLTDARDPAIINFTIGTGECDPFNYCNKPLKENNEYALKVRTFTCDRFQDTNVVYFETSERLPVGYISLVLGGIFLVGCVSTFLSAIPLDVLCLRLFSVRKLASPSTILFKSYSSRKFERHANDLLKTNGRLRNEFHLLGTLSSNLTTPSLHAQRIDNRGKNRYGDVLPFDFTRVELSVMNGDPSTDYINASYIKGYQQQIEYIAAQGPKKETCYDFYRMIIENNIGVIVMLTDLEANGIELCYKYFPDVGSTLKFRDIEVYCNCEEDKDFCIRRKLVLKSDRCRNGEFQVVHLHFEDWPDFNCPQDAEDVIRLCEYTRRISYSGYRLVHGTAGTGRPGTFIALDILLQSLENNDKISVFKTVLELRQQRVNMVQTLDQYAFIYMCISMALNNTTGNKCEITEL